MFRAKFMMMWIVGNAVFIITVKSWMSSSGEEKNSGEVNFIVGFSFFIASLALFRFFTALFHIIRHKIRVYDGLLAIERKD